MPSPFKHTHFCGLFYFANHTRKYIPQVKMAAHATILSSVARTTLTQTFENTDPHDTWKEVKYTFPLMDGVSVVAFTCTIGDRVIKGVVKEKQKAREVYEEARDRGSGAALLEQVTEASDVFLTSVGNVPPKTKVQVEITYLGELTHDAEVDGIRGTIPTIIAPRYGDLPVSMRANNAAINTAGKGGLEIVVDAQMPAGSTIKSIQSPSHPISVSIGTLSTAPDAEPSLQNASASLSLSNAELEKDFIIQVVATNISNPVALLETHPTLPNERALMATLVPKFALPPERPEIVFVCDRSGSMGYQGKIENLKAALQIFLKSLPVGVKFNICSFGSSHSFLWKQSRTYDKASLEEAIRHVGTFDARMGGTEMHPALEDVFKRRYGDMNLEVLLLTDGDIWNPGKFFELIRKNREESKNAIRLFTLAIGSTSSSALTEGAARAGNGFSQSVGDKEKMNSKVVRMLKTALTPHINDYTLEVKYEAENGSDDDFELVEKVEDCLVIEEQTQSAEPAIPQKTTSLFDPSVDVDAVMGNTGETQDKYDHLPPVTPPKLLQAPFEIPSLYPFNRTSVYILMSNETIQRPVKSVVLRGTSRHGPLELEIPVTTLDEPGETVHQLAARKAVKELEEGAGWIYHAKDADHKLLREKHTGRFSDMVEREAVRLGVKYQVGGKWCSFVAVEEKDSVDISEKKEQVVNLTAAVPQPDPGPTMRYRSIARDPAAVRYRKVASNSDLSSSPSPSPPPPQVNKMMVLCASSTPPPSASGYISIPEPRGQAAPPRPAAAPQPPPAPPRPSPAPRAQPAGAPLPSYGGPSVFSSNLPATSGALFGAAPQAQGAPALNSGSSLFGGAPSCSPLTSGGGLFGAASQSPPAPAFNSGSSLFGQPSSHSPATSGSAFGVPSQAQPSRIPETDDLELAFDSFSPQPEEFSALEAPSVNLSEDCLVRGERMDSLSSPEVKVRRRCMSARVENEPSKKRKSVQFFPDEEVKGAQKPSLPTDKLEALVSLQKFDGSWPPSEDVFRVIGVSQKEIEEALRAKGADWSEGLVKGGADVLATAGVLAFLKGKLGGQEEEWEMIGDKGWDLLVGAVPGLDGNRGDFEACLAGLFN